MLMWNCWPLSLLNFTYCHWNFPVVSSCKAALLRSGGGWRMDWVSAELLKWGRGWQMDWGSAAPHFTSPLLLCTWWLLFPREGIAHISCCYCAVYPEEMLPSMVRNFAEVIDYYFSCIILQCTYFSFPFFLIFWDGFSVAFGAHIFLM